jgi:hypothetical protein
MMNLSFPISLINWLIGQSERSNFRAETGHLPLQTGA